MAEVVSSNWQNDRACRLEDYALLGIPEYWIADYQGPGAEIDPEIDHLYRDQYRRRFKWIRANLFRLELQQHLQQDATALIGILQLAGSWNPLEDGKLTDVLRGKTCKIVPSFSTTTCPGRLLGDYLIDSAGGAGHRIGQQADEILCHLFLPAEEDEVDLTSEALQIWQRAIEANPALKGMIEKLPDVVYSTKEHEPTGTDPEGVLPYLRTDSSTDALAWIRTTTASLSRKCEFYTWHGAVLIPQPCPVIPT
ncbi:MAG: Uma2 family endonuclease [Thermostichus sp. HHBFW_bins_43]